MSVKAGEVSQWKSCQPIENIDNKVCKLIAALGIWNSLRDKEPH